MLKNTALCAMTLAAILATCQAHAEQSRSINVPAGDLTAALETLIRQSGVELVYRPEQLKGLRTQGVRGKLSLEEAVRKLIEGTSLVVSADPDSGVLLISTPNEIGKSTGATNRIVISLALSEAGSASEPPGSGEVSPLAGENKQESPAEITVTGTHIRGAAPGSSPVKIYGRKEIEQSGAGTVEQFIRTIPQNFALIGEDTAASVTDSASRAQVNGVHGASVNLRGLGAGSTLVLVNGRRIAQAGSDGSFVDVSMLPLSAVERVDVVTDGASAIYGADAVAGVVNFVLRKDFDGFDTGMRYNDTTRGGASGVTVSQLLGKSWSTGGMLVSYEYHDRNPLYASQRDFIPDRAGVYMVMPQQRRRSAYLNFRQELSDRAELTATALRTDRDFARDTTLATTITHATGGSGGKAFSLGMTYDLPAAWRADIAADHSSHSSGVVTISPALPGPSSNYVTKSKVSSFGLKFDGPAVAAPGGAIRVSAGADARRERFDDLDMNGAGANLQRDVFSVYAEALAPLVGEGNARGGVRRLEVNVAVRYDRYGDIGSSVDPKIGVSWSPLSGLGFRGTYTESYRVPPLANLSPYGHRYIVTRIPDPTPEATEGATDTLVTSSAQNPALVPERSTSFTAGIDFRPGRLPGLSLSLTYFEIDYRNRIANPPIIGSFFQLYQQVDTLAPFIDRTPDPAEVQRIFDSGELIANIPNVPPSGVEAVFDNRLQNIARTRQSGCDFSADYDFSSAFGEIGLTLGGQYLRKMEYRAASTTPAVDSLNTVFKPMDLRLRGGLRFTRGGVSSSLTVNYSDDYVSNLVTPVVQVDSWTTVDWQFAVRAGDRARWAMLSNTSLTFGVLNLLDEDPPFLFNPQPAANFGYDATNASPLGRSIHAQVSKKW